MTARVIAVCSLLVILALVAGVGPVSHTVLHHLAQTLPLWVPVVLGFRGARPSGWIALPMFIFWLVLMVAIWLFLLHLSSFIRGHFTPIEIAMTLIVGAACVFGILSLARHRSGLGPGAAILYFLAGLLAQLACFRLSMVPMIWKN